MLPDVASLGEDRGLPRARTRRIDGRDHLRLVEQGHPDAERAAVTEFLFARLALEDHWAEAETAVPHPHDPGYADAQRRVVELMVAYRDQWQREAAYCERIRPAPSPAALAEARADAVRKA